MQHLIDHLEKYIGPVTEVFSEKMDHFPVQICHIEPGPARAYHTLVTAGMSNLPMIVPDDKTGEKRKEYAELIVFLPENWPITRDAWDEEKYYWPIAWLRLLARFPHGYKTFLGSGHMIPNGDPPLPFAENTEFCGIFLAPPIMIDRQACTILDSERKIQLLCMHPLYLEEMNWKKKRGASALMKRMDLSGFDDVIDLERRSYLLLSDSIFETLARPDAEYSDSIKGS